MNIVKFKHKKILLLCLKLKNERIFSKFVGLEDFEMKIDQIAGKESGAKSEGIRANKRSADDDWIANLYHQFNDPLSSKEDIEANEVSDTMSPSTFG